MKRLNRVFLGLFLIMAVSTPAKAAGPSILAFQINGIGVFPEFGSNIYSGQAAWIPSLSGGSIGVRGELGAAWLKNALGDRFWQFNYEAFLVFSLSPVTDIELGGGLATWAGGNGGTHPVLSADLAISVPGVLKRLFVGYSRFMMPGLYSHQFKAGLGFSF